MEFIGFEWASRFGSLVQSRRVAVLCQGGFNDVHRPFAEISAAALLTSPRNESATVKAELPVPWSG